MSCCRVFRINNNIKKRIVVAFGRYQPPHCGHKTIFDDMVSMINDPNNIADEGYIYVMGFATNVKGLKRNPLGPNEKLKYLNKMLPNRQIKFIIGNSVGDMLSPETKTLLGDRLIVMPLPTERELAERKDLGDKWAFPKVANLYKIHFWFKDRGEENDYMIIAGEDRVSQIKRANKTRKTKFPISEAGQKRSAAAQTGDVCTVDDSPSGSRIRHLALSIDSFSLKDSKVQKILKFTKLGNMTDEDVLDMVNDIRKVNGKPEIYNVTEDEIMLGGRRKTRKKRRKTKRKNKKGGVDESLNTRRRIIVNGNDPAGPRQAHRQTNPFLQNTGFVAPEGPARPRLPPNVDEGRYFDPNLSEGVKLPEDKQPCSICRENITNKGENHIEVRPRQCFTCKKLFHYTCLGKWFVSCTSGESTCPMCKNKWKYDNDVVYLKTIGREKIQEEERMRREAMQMTNQVPSTNFDVAVTRPSRLSRFCRFITPRRSRRIAPRGGKRRRRKKTRKKKGNGGVFSRRRKHISIVDPKEKYINLALKKLITDPEWKNADVVAQVQMMRNLAIQLEEDDKKGGRRRKSKRKTRRKKKNKR